MYLRACPTPSAAVESTGAAKAEAQSRAEAARIQGEAAVQEAKLKVEALRIEAVRILPTSTPFCHCSSHWATTCPQWSRKKRLPRSVLEAFS